MSTMLKREIVQNIIGKTFADGLDRVVFECGNMTYTKRTMVDELHCGNYIAAVNLAKVLRRLGVVSAAQIYRLGPDSLMRAKGIGDAAIFVAMCILHAEGYSVPKWWGWDEDNQLKFHSYRKHVIQRAKKRKQDVPDNIVKIRA